MFKHFLVLLQALMALIPLPSLAGNEWIYLARTSPFMPSGPGLHPGAPATPATRAWYLDATGFFQAVELDGNDAVVCLREKQNAGANPPYGGIAKVLAESGSHAMPADAGVTYAGIAAVSVPERAIIYAGAGSAARLVYSGPLAQMPQELQPLFSRLARESAHLPQQTLSGGNWLHVRPDRDGIRRRSITLTPEKIAPSADIAKSLNAPMRMVKLNQPDAFAAVFGAKPGSGNWLAVVDYEGGRYFMRRHQAAASPSPACLKGR